MRITSTGPTRHRRPASNHRTSPGRAALLEVFAVAALAVAVLPAITSPAAAGEAPTPTAPVVEPAERVQAYTEPSVVYLSATWTGWVFDTFNKRYLNNGQPFVLNAHCTGFMVNPDGYIATAGHCVDPRDDSLTLEFQTQAAQSAVDTGFYPPGTTVEQVLAGDQLRVEGADNKNKPDLQMHATWGSTGLGVEFGQTLAARTVSFQPFDQGDVALVKVEASDLNAMPIASEDSVSVGTEIVSVGYPGSVEDVADTDLSPSYKSGTISQQTTVQGGLLPVYEIDAAVSGGMSGGPVVNTDGQVVGLNSFGNAFENQPFNFMRPTSQLQEVLAGAGVQNELSASTRLYRTGLDAYFAGDKTTAVRALSAVTRQQPTNGFAQQYLTKARALPDPPAPPSSFPTGLLIGGLALLLLLGAGGWFLLRRRRGQTPVSPAPTAAAPTTQPSGPAAARGDGAYGPATSSSPAAQPTGFAPPQRAGTGGLTPSPPLTAPGAQPAQRPATAGTGPGYAGPTSGPAMAASAATPTPTPAPDAAAGTATAPGIPQQRHAFCTTCGTHAEDADQRFCGNCGEAL